MQARRLIIVALGFALLVLAPAATAALASSGSNSQDAPASGEAVVTAQDYTFTPAYPVVAVGTTVTWVNLDGESHTVTSDVGLFDTEIEPGEQFSLTFDAPGAYFFYCQPHDWMIGEVTVVPNEGRRGTAQDSGGNLGSPTADVAMLGYEFQPPAVTIQAGGAVIWTNYDADQHTATAAEQASWSTALLSGGQSEALQFAEPGTYAYACTIHPSMLGEVIVLLVA